VRPDGHRLPEILVDVDDADPFLDRELRPELLEQACETAGQPLTLRRHAGYDHPTISFMADHLRWHAARLVQSRLVMAKFEAACRRAMRLNRRAWDHVHDRV